MLQYLWHNFTSKGDVNKDWTYSVSSTFIFRCRYNSIFFRFKDRNHTLCVTIQLFHSARRLLVRKQISLTCMSPLLILQNILCTFYKKQQQQHFLRSDYTYLVLNCCFLRIWNPGHIHAINGEPTIVRPSIVQLPELYIWVR